MKLLQSVRAIAAKPVPGGIDGFVVHPPNEVFEFIRRKSPSYNSHVHPTVDGMLRRLAGALRSYRWFAGTGRPGIPSQFESWPAIASLSHLEATMSRSLEALAEEVLQLPADARTRLLDRIVASLDADHRRDEAWDAVAARRDAEIESGVDSLLSGTEVLARLRAEVK